jgi:hypothetical protein
LKMKGRAKRHQASTNTALLVSANWNSRYKRELTKQRVINMQGTIYKEDRTLNPV